MKKIKHWVFQLPRILKYRILSNNRVAGGGRIIQPVLFMGKGKIEIESSAILGVNPSPFLYSGYIHIEARKKDSKIYIGKNVWMNNNCVMISAGKGITIGDLTLLGSQVEIYDSDFHNLSAGSRRGGAINTAPVEIGKNVFIGSNSSILKGVTIGENSVIANNSVVVSSIPDNVIAGGNPAKIIRELPTF